MLIVTDPKQFEELRKGVHASLGEELIDTQKQLILKTFHTARLDSTAQACIDTAFEFGFTEMGAEMEKDLVLERILVNVRPY